MVEGTPPGDALPPPPQRATPARKGARCGAVAGFPRPHRRHPGHTGRGTLAARSRGRAAGGGTAPDTRRPSQRPQANPPGDGPPPSPRHAAPTGHAGQGDSVGPPHPHTRAHSTWVADPNSPSSGRVVGGVTAPDLRRPSQWWKAPPPGTPFRHPHSEQRRPARAHAVEPVLGPYARTDRTRDTLVAEPRLPAPEGAAGGGTAPDTRRPSQRWQATPPGDGRPPPPQHAAPTGHAGQGDSVGPPHRHTCDHSMWVVDPNSPPSGRAVGGGGAPDLRRRSQRWKAPPPGMPFSHPNSEQRRPARAHAVGPVLGPHARTDCTRDTRVAEPRLRAPEDGRLGEGQRLTPDAPHNGGRPPPPGTAPHHPRGTQPRQGMQAKGTVLGPPHPHARAHSMWVADPNSPLSGRAVQGGGAPAHRRPLQRWKAPPPGTPFRHPHSEQRRPARAHAVGLVLGPTPAPTAPRTHGSRNPGYPPQRTDGRGGTAPDTRRPSQRWQTTPPKGFPPPPRHAAPTGHAGQGDSLRPPHPHTRAQSTWVADPNSPPSGRAVRGGGAPDLRRPSQRWRAPPRGSPSAPPTVSNAGLQGRTLWNRCWVHTPASTAPGTHGSRHPGPPPQRTRGRGRDSA